MLYLNNMRTNCKCVICLYFISSNILSRSERGLCIYNVHKYSGIIFRSTQHDVDIVCLCLPCTWWLCVWTSTDAWVGVQVFKYQSLKQAGGRGGAKTSLPKLHHSPWGNLDRRCMMWGISASDIQIVPRHAVLIEKV